MLVSDSLRAFWRRHCCRVLILVLVDVGLGRVLRVQAHQVLHLVLILVLVDVGLGRSEDKYAEALLALGS